jgi:hypothetical protein
MKDALLQTKLQRPPIAPDIVPRKRLWDSCPDHSLPERMIENTSHNPRKVAII